MSAAVEQGELVWVTGAGSGIGRASALQAAAAGFRVALTGRTTERLEEVAALIEAAGGRALVAPADLDRDDALDSAVTSIERAWGPVTAAVLAAGRNVPNRMWADQRPEDFDQVLRTNLTSTVHAIDRLLPGMRRAGRGRFVLLSSWAAWRYAHGAGVGYAASKTALAAVAESVNGQENRHGIQACHLCPGDVDTGFLDQRPSVPGAEARSVMLTPEEVAASVLFVLEQPSWIAVNELVLSPIRQGPYRLWE